MTILIYIFLTSYHPIETSLIESKIKLSKKRVLQHTEALEQGISAYDNYISKCLPSVYVYIVATGIRCIHSQGCPCNVHFKNTCVRHDSDCDIPHINVGVFQDARTYSQSSESDARSDFKVS